jgi:hypothetical protein
VITHGVKYIPNILHTLPLPPACLPPFSCQRQHSCPYTGAALRFNPPGIPVGSTASVSLRARPERTIRTGQDKAARPSTDGILSISAPKTVSADHSALKTSRTRQATNLQGARHTVALQPTLPSHPFLSPPTIAVTQSMLLFSSYSPYMAKSRLASAPDLHTARNPGNRDTRSNCSVCTNSSPSSPSTPPSAPSTSCAWFTLLSHCGSYGRTWTDFNISCVFAH